jgi:hypothetical protein
MESNAGNELGMCVDDSADTTIFYNVKNTYRAIIRTTEHKLPSRMDSHTTNPILVIGKSHQTDTR